MISVAFWSCTTWAPEVASERACVESCRRLGDTSPDDDNQVTLWTKLHTILRTHPVSFECDSTGVQ